MYLIVVYIEPSNCLHQYEIKLVSLQKCVLLLAGL